MSDKKAPTNPEGRVMDTVKATKQPKPIATVDGAVKAEIYRATFKPFDVLKYLDRKALKKAEQATFEIGTISGGGVTATLAIEVARGVVTGIRPVFSASLPKPPKGGPSATTQKKVLLEALKKLGSHGPVPLDLPKPIALFWEDPWEIDIGPITIILGGGLSNICINVAGGTDGVVCSYCLFGVTVCSQTGPPQ